MCKTSELMRDMAVLTYFKKHKPMFKDEWAIYEEALDHVVAHGAEIVKAELVERQYCDLLLKLSEFELKHPQVVNNTPV